MKGGAVGAMTNDWAGRASSLYGRMGLETHVQWGTGAVVTTFAGGVSDLLLVQVSRW